MKKRAFTLIELLVVISIIALLLSILMPALSKVKAQARAVVCISNLKQWGLVFNLYTADNGGRYWVDPTSSTGPERLWMNRLADIYEDNDQFRICPSGNLPNQIAEANEASGTYVDTIGKSDTVWVVYASDPLDPSAPMLKYEGSYGINHWLNNVDNAGPWPGGWRSRPEQQFARDDQTGASNIPLLMDCAFYGSNPETAPFEAGALIPDRNDYVYEEMYTNGNTSVMWNDIARFAINRHNKAINGVFMDGSARKVPLAELWKLKWHRTAKPYDVDLPGELLN